MFQGCWLYATSSGVCTRGAGHVCTTSASQQEGLHPAQRAVRLRAPAAAHQPAAAHLLRLAGRAGAGRGARGDPLRLLRQVRLQQALPEGGQREAGPVAARVQVLAVQALQVLQHSHGSPRVSALPGTQASQAARTLVSAGPSSAASPAVARQSACSSRTHLLWGLDDAPELCLDLLHCGDASWRRACRLVLTLHSSARSELPCLHGTCQGSSWLQGKLALQAGPARAEKQAAATSSRSDEQAAARVTVRACGAHQGGIRRPAEVAGLDPVRTGVEGLERVRAVQSCEAELALLGQFLLSGSARRPD